MSRTQGTIAPRIWLTIGNKNVKMYATYVFNQKYVFYNTAKPKDLVMLKLLYGVNLPPLATVLTNALAFVCCFSK